MCYTQKQSRQQFLICKEDAPKIGLAVGTLEPSHILERPAVIFAIVGSPNQQVIGDMEKWRRDGAGLLNSQYGLFHGLRSESF